MPRIHEYNSQVEAPGPINQPSEGEGSAFGAQVALEGERRASVLQQAGQKITDLGGVLQERQAESEISDLAAQLAAKKADYLDRHEKLIRNVDLSDRDQVRSLPQKMSELMGQYQDDIEEMRGNIQTRQGSNWFTHQSGLQEATFREIQDKGEIEVNGLQQRRDFENELQSQSAALMRHPDNYDQTKVEVLNSINAKKFLSPEARFQLEDHAKKEMAEAAVRGHIANPQTTQTIMNQLQQGAWSTELNAQQIDQLITHAHQTITGRRADQAYADAQKQKALAARQEAAMSDMLNQVVEPGKFGTLTSHQIINDPRLDFQAREHMLGYLWSASNETRIVEDPSFVNRMFADVAAGKIRNTDPIDQAVRDLKMKPSTARLLIQDQKGRTSTEGEVTAQYRDHFMKEYATPLIDPKSNPVIGKLDTEGQLRLFNYRTKVLLPMEEQYKKENKDPRTLYMPDSPNFLGKKDVIEPYTPKLDEVIQKVLQGLKSPPPPSGPTAAAGPQPQTTVAGNFPGMLTPGNINLNNRPKVPNADGSISTVRSTSVNIDGNEVLLPTVSDEGKNLTVPEAVAQYKKTGKHLGIFSSPAAATNYAQALHQQQAATLAPNSPEKTVVAKDYSPSRNKTKITYSDGSTEVVNGRP